MEKKYVVIAPFTLVTIFNHRDFWQEGFDFVFEELLIDVIDGVHDGCFENQDDLYKFSCLEEDEFEWMEKMGWIAEEKENKHIKVKSGTHLKSSDEDEVYVYALVKVDEFPIKLHYNLINLNYGTRFFDDGVLVDKKEISIGELNDLSEYCSFSVVGKLKK